MGILVNLVLANIFLVGFSGLALMYGRADGKRLIDSFHRFLTTTLIDRLSSTVRILLGQASLDKVENVFDYILNRRNPLTMILYLVLLVGGYCVFVMFGYPHLPNRSLSFEYHRQCGFALFVLSMYFFSRACSDDPGILTKSNHKLHSRTYPFDQEVFKGGVECDTCKFPKPARSKHCSVCNVCVARFDHHCVWINQCVGKGNARSFLLFLFFNNVICLYGGYLGTFILADIVERDNLRSVTFRDSKTGQTYQSSLFYIFMYLLGKEMVLMYLTLFSMIMGVFLLAFSYYHLVKLMRMGITTNENSKLLKVENKEKFIRLHSQGTWFKNLCHALRG